GTIRDSLSGVDLTKATYVVSDEYGWVQPSGTFSVNADGTYSFTIQLQAQRDGQDQDGRVYTILVADLDQAGNKGTIRVVVTVPHDQGSGNGGNDGSYAAVATNVGPLASLSSNNLSPDSPISSSAPRGPLMRLRGFTAVRRNRPAQAPLDRRS